MGGRELPKPAVVVMAYAAHSEHSSDEPPTFVVVGDQVHAKGTAQRSA